ncbi:pentapeptide repeat-containing protein [Nocardia sp. NPDC059691]|uniref:pentapeptide repeat-containing protein n=1 Tax=Nocardia sp. NPDC059691 TaxID=3346908 RepID=UPI003680F6CA
MWTQITPISRMPVTGTDLTQATLTGADLTGANLADVICNESTIWPTGFEPPRR